MGIDGRRRTLLVQATLATTVWLGWLGLGRGHAIAAIRAHWPVSVTMTLGSLVGGGTSEGGGAVAFPAFTKVLMIPADQARTFTYAIQAVGMTAASLCILWLRVPIERRALLLAAPAGVVGVLVSTTLIAPSVPLPIVRVYFTVLLTSLAIALMVLRLRRLHDRNELIPVFGRRERLILIGTGLLGGLLSGLVGVGENTVAFIVLVLLFRVSEKIATPTTVILMTVVSVAAFFSHAVLLRDFTAPVTDYWLAAVPIVVVGAPLGAVICARLSARTICTILIALIAVEFVSTLVLVPMTGRTLLTAAGLLVAASVGFYLLTSVRAYRPIPERAEQRIPAAV